MSRAKFKVGDKVRILDGSKIVNYTSGWASGMKKYVGDVETISAVDTRPGARTAYRLGTTGYWWDERGLELVFEIPNWKVVITPYGNRTIGRMYEGDKLVKEVYTVKSPEDEYSMEEAVKVICERLTKEPEKKEELPKLYNGKVVCVDNGENKDYTIGKIYQFMNGYVRMDDGTKMPFKPIHTFEEWAKWSTAKWIEVVE